MILEVTSRTIEPDITVCELQGKLNLGNSLMSLENLIRKTIDTGTKKLILDLSRLSAIDSAGIGLLLNSSGLIEQKGGRMVISAAQGNVAHTFHTVHLDRVVSCCADMDSAILILGEAAGEAAPG